MASDEIKTGAVNMVAARPCEDKKETRETAVPDIKNRRDAAGEKVILVEKDRAIRSSIARVLLKMQYSVDCFEDLSQAIASSQLVKARLVVLGVYETELLDMVLSQFPTDAGLLIITDASCLPAAAQTRCCAIRSFLVRPFSPRQLADCVRQTIDGVNQISESIRSSALAEIDNKQIIFPKTEDSFQHLLSMLTARTGAVYASILLRDTGAGAYTVRAEKGIPRHSWCRMCERLLGRDGTSAINIRSAATPEIARLMSEAGLECVMCTPLVVRREIVGIIAQIKTEPGASFKPSDMAFTSLLARQFGLGLENTALSENMRAQQSYVQKLLSEISRAQTNERRRVATEIHDGVAQWLVGAALDITACHQLIGCHQLNGVEDSLLRVKGTLQNSIRELRRAIADLRPELLIRLGLVDAITQSVEALRQEGIDCELKIEGAVPEFSMAVESNVYWIVQELLSNIRKHAGASRVDVSLNNMDGRFCISIEDDGQGFNAEAVMASSLNLEHVGIMGMRERAELLGAELTLSSIPGRGTTGRLVLPAVMT